MFYCWWLGWLNEQIRTQKLDQIKNNICANKSRRVTTLKIINLNIVLFCIFIIYYKISIFNIYYFFTKMLDKIIFVCDPKLLNSSV